MFHSDGKADYVWTRASDSAPFVWLNNYPNTPTWLEQGQVAEGVHTSGANVRYAKLQDTGRASYVAVDPKTGAIAAWLNGCEDRGPAPDPEPEPEPEPATRRVVIALFVIPVGEFGHTQQYWEVFSTEPGEPVYFCDDAPIKVEGPVDAEVPSYPTEIPSFEAHDASECTYTGSGDEVGTMKCDGVDDIECKKSPQYGESLPCIGAGVFPAVRCDW